MHPRTNKKIQENRIELSKEVLMIEPQGYLKFLSLISNARFIMSDSGGIQEEALAINVPCLILRNETEWTRLVKAGKNILTTTEQEKIIEIAEKLILDNEELRRIKDINYPFLTNSHKKIVEVLKKWE